MLPGRRGASVLLCLTCCHGDQTPDKFQIHHCPVERQNYKKKKSLKIIIRFHHSFHALFNLNIFVTENPQFLVELTTVTSLMSVKS